MTSTRCFVRAELTLSDAGFLRLNASLIARFGYEGVQNEGVTIMKQLSQMVSLSWVLSEAHTKPQESNHDKHTAKKGSHPQDIKSDASESTFFLGQYKVYP